MFPRFVFPTSDLFEAQYYEALRQQQLMNALAAIQYQQEIEQERERRRAYEQRLRQQQQRENAQRALNALLFNLPAVQQYFYDEEEDEEEEPVIEIVVKRPQRPATARQQPKRAHPQQQQAVNVKRDSTTVEKKKPQTKPVQNAHPAAAATASASRPTEKPQEQPQPSPRRAKIVVHLNETPNNAPVEVPVTIKRIEVPQPVADANPVQESKPAPRRIKIPIYSREEEKQPTPVVQSVEVPEVTKEAPQPQTVEEPKTSATPSFSTETSDIVIHLNSATEEEAAATVQSSIPSEPTAEIQAPQPSSLHNASSLPGDLLIVINNEASPTNEEREAQSINEVATAPEMEQPLVAPQPAPQETSPAVEQRRYEKEQNLLQQIGFNDEKLNEELLTKFNGDVKQVVNALLKL